jgi:hypothetical protein
MNPRTNDIKFVIWPLSFTDESGDDIGETSHDASESRYGAEPKFKVNLKAVRKLGSNRILQFTEIYISHLISGLVDHVSSVNFLQRLGAAK